MNLAQEDLRVKAEGAGEVIAGLEQRVDALTEERQQLQAIAEQHEANLGELRQAMEDAVADYSRQLATAGLERDNAQARMSELESQVEELLSAQARSAAAAEAPASRADASSSPERHPRASPAAEAGSGAAAAMAAASESDAELPNAVSESSVADSGAMQSNPLFSPAKGMPGVEAEAVTPDSKPLREPGTGKKLAALQKALQQKSDELAAAQEQVHAAKAELQGLQVWIDLA